jgi:hypothetical protein
MDNEPSLESRVIDFVARFCLRNPATICLETTLLWDLGIDADDAHDFFSQYSDTFRVDLKDFKFTQYFGSEGGVWPWTPIQWLINYSRKGFKEEKFGLDPITIAELVVAAKKHKWL